MHTFVYNGKKSQDFNLILSGEDTWKKPMADIERMQIPGRNGDLLLSNHRYSNVTITYHVGIRRGFDKSFSAFMNFLLQEPGYHRLEDSYHPEYYRKAVMNTDLDTFDLIVSGHYHGGQWRVWNRSVYVPRTGLFMKDSRGQFDRLIISAGTANTTRFPRYGNPCELVMIEI